MNTVTSCPRPEELRQLLDGALSGERQEEYTRHMDSCVGCQAKLEELATGGTNLSDVVAKLDDAEPVAASAYWPALKSLDAEVKSVEARSTDARVQETFVPRSESISSKAPSLSFLQPASDAAYLGRLAQFDVMRVIGRGGMGLVLEAFDSRLQRNVAIKVLDPELAEDEVARQRFCREARAAASITHENVVAVHQVERSGDAGLPYLVMQLVSGESLEQRLTREKKLPLREIVRIGMQAAQGLVAAHAQGLIHRDIKPGNILLEPPHDRVKLTDFGLARAAEDVKLTRTGYVSGTPLYMAPEQALGEEPDFRSDLFSLGAVLYEMCAGQPPFAGNSALAILKQIAEKTPQPIRELNPSIPQWFADTIDRLLAKKPEHRIQSAAHLAELLEFEWALLKTASDDVPVVCQIEERRIARRNRWIAAGVATTFLALGILAGSFLNRGGAPAKDIPAAAASPEPVAVLTASAGTVWSVAFDPTGETVAMAVEDGSVRLWDLPTRTIKNTINAHRGIIWSARFSHDGELLATASDDGLVKLWKLPQGELLKSFEHPNAVRSVACSSDHRTLFTGSRDGSIRVWSVDAEAPRAETRQGNSIYAVALSPDDEILATAGSDKVIRLWNAATLGPKLTLEGHTGPINGLSFHPGGRRLASAGWDKLVRVWDTGSGELVKSWSGHDGDIWGLTYSPDGTKIATGGHDGVVKLWNAETGELIEAFVGHKLAIHTVAFNRQGTQLASGSRDGTVRIWQVPASTGVK